MFLDVKTLAITNLAVQLLLIVTVSFTAYLAIKKRDFRKHCVVLRVAIPVQIIAVAIVMLPSMRGYIEYTPGILFSIEMLIHHTLGLAIIALWLYINLVVGGILKVKGRLAVPMRIALTLWVLVFLIGIHIYIVIWM